MFYNEGPIMSSEKFPDRNGSSLFKLYNVSDYVSMFKDDILNIFISTENVNNMFEECFEIIRFSCS